MADTTTTNAGGADAKASSLQAINLADTTQDKIVSLSAQAQEHVEGIVRSTLVKIFGYGIVALAFGLCVYFFTEMYGFNGRLNRIEGFVESGILKEYVELKIETGATRNAYSELKKCVLDEGIKDKKDCLK